MCNRQLARAAPAVYLRRQSPNRHAASDRRMAEACTGGISLSVRTVGAKGLPFPLRGPNVLPHPTFRHLSTGAEDEAGAAGLPDERVPQMTQLVDGEIAPDPLWSLPAAGIEVVAF